MLDEYLAFVLRANRDIKVGVDAIMTFLDDQCWNTKCTTSHSTVQWFGFRLTWHTCIPPEAFVSQLSSTSVKVIVTLWLMTSNFSEDTRETHKHTINYYDNFLAKNIFWQVTCLRAIHPYMFVCSDSFNLTSSMERILRVECSPLEWWPFAL